MDILTFLNENITTKTPLSEILDVFCKMCEVELPKSQLLFETGVFSFTCDEQYYFSLVRQSSSEYSILKDEPIYKIDIYDEGTE